MSRVRLVAVVVLLGAGSMIAVGVWGRLDPAGFADWAGWPHRSIELASRGWEVVGIDVVPRAISVARRQAQSRGAEVTFLEGDVTRLRDVGVDPAFSLFLDVECFNHLDDAQREVVGREIDALAAPDATLLMLVWKRARRGPLPPGATTDDLARTFPRWQIVDDEPYDGEMPAPLKGTAPRWYRLART